VPREDDERLVPREDEERLVPREDDERLVPREDDERLLPEDIDQHQQEEAGQNLIDQLDGNIIQPHSFESMILCYILLCT
jgi:hypothetical protein